MKIKFARTLSLMLAALCLFTACKKDNDPPAENPPAEQRKLSIEVKGEGYPLTVRDYLDEETVLENAPQRVAVLSGTPLNVWYDLGGKSVCTSTISSNLKLIPQYSEEIKALPSVGKVHSVNLEAIVAQTPDLIIAQAGSQAEEVVKLRQMGYKVITTLLRTYDDVVDTYRAFGKILGCSSLAEEKIAALETAHNALLDKVPENGKKVVIFYLTSKTLSVKLNNSIAGGVAAELGLVNIAADFPPDEAGAENAPIDMEYILASQPDVVLVTSMISDNETARTTMEQQFASNPAWQGVNAVKEGRVVYLPQEYFLYNAGPYYNESIEFMARSVYPEIYGNVDEWYGK